MSPALKRYRDSAIVVLLLAVPFFVLKANMKSPENQNAMDHAILRVSAPVEVAAAHSFAIRWRRSARVPVRPVQLSSAPLNPVRLSRVRSSLSLEKRDRWRTAAAGDCSLL